MVIEERERLAVALRGAGWEVGASQANFVLGRPPGGDAVGVAAELREQRILVRHFPGGEHSDRLRITVGTPAQNAALLTALGIGGEPRPGRPRRCRAVPLRVAPPWRPDHDDPRSPAQQEEGDDPHQNSGHQQRAAAEELLEPGAWPVLTRKDDRSLRDQVDRTPHLSLSSGALTAADIVSIALLPKRCGPRNPTPPAAGCGAPPRPGRARPGSAARPSSARPVPPGNLIRLVGIPRPSR